MPSTSLSETSSGPVPDRRPHDPRTVAHLAVDPDQEAAVLLGERYPQLRGAILSSDRLHAGLRALRLASGASPGWIAAEVGARELDTAQRPIGVLVSRCSELVASLRSPAGPSTSRWAVAGTAMPVRAEDLEEPEEDDVVHPGGSDVGARDDDLVDDGDVPPEAALQRGVRQRPLDPGRVEAASRVPHVATPVAGGPPRAARPHDQVARRGLASPRGRLTLDDLLQGTDAPVPRPPTRGWQSAVRRLSGGLLTPEPSDAEQAHRRDVAAVQASLGGPRTVVVVNPKGGANKTTAALLIAATFGVHRGGYTLAWDNNETNGTLGWRARQPGHHRATAVDLLRDLDRFASVAGRVGDLDDYVRSQTSAQFDVLASDEDPQSNAVIDDTAFLQLHHTLQRFYRVMVVDTGNNVRASNWQAAVEVADQIVVVTTVAEDTGKAAAWLADSLRAGGGEEKLANAVTVVASPARSVDAVLRERLHTHFGALTRAVVDVPYDKALVGGRPIVYDALSEASREAWLQVAVAVSEGLAPPVGTLAPARAGV